MTRVGGVAVVLAACSVSLPARSEPIVSVWYRGTPPGTPVQDELAAIRALGFTSVTCPASQAAGVAELRRQAALVSLAVDVRAPKTPLTIESSRSPEMVTDVLVPSLPPPLLAATVWRAIAHGEKLVERSGPAIGPVGGDLDRVSVVAERAPQHRRVARHRGHDAQRIAMRVNDACVGIALEQTLESEQVTGRFEHPPCAAARARACIFGAPAIHGGRLRLQVL